MKSVIPTYEMFQTLKQALNDGMRVTLCGDNLEALFFISLTQIEAHTDDGVLVWDFELYDNDEEIEVEIYQLLNSTDDYF